jgi:uncharacterized membrane protein
MRSAMPVAALAWRGWAADRGNQDAGETRATLPRPLLAHPLALTVSTLAALGELTADKLPFVPARISFAPLLARGFSGAWSAAALARGGHRSPVRGALYGAIGAVAASFGGYYLRRALSRRVGSALTVALAEDALAIGVAALAVSARGGQAARAWRSAAARA